MAAFSIALGTTERVASLFAYPNVPGSGATLGETVLHWVDQSLERDGLKGRGARAAVRLDGEILTLELAGPDELADTFALYARRLPGLLDAGWEALTVVIPELREEGLWDPEGCGQWRFFLPLGLALANQRALQFFHYPPIRLLDAMQDYLDDPVPVRWEELLKANGVADDATARLYETVIDATPIAAPDDQGSKVSPKGDPHWGLIPIQRFPAYQQALVRLLLNPGPGHAGYTIPIVVYGAHPREIFQELYLGKGRLGVNQAATAEIIPGLKTPVLGANHPYRFYAQAQIDAAHPETGYVGSGHIVPGQCAGVVPLMIADLAAARWQVLMAEDPSQDPAAVLEACTAYWRDPAQAERLCALVRHQGSLLYPDPKALDFTFALEPEAAAQLCADHGGDPCASQ